MTQSQYTTELRYIRNVSATTLDLYKYSFQTFEGALDNRASVVQRVGELRDKGMKPVTLNTYLRCVNAYFMWLHKEHGKELIKIPFLKEEKTLLQTLKPSEVSAILRQKPETAKERQFHVLCCLLLDTGLRIDEALSLPVKDIDFDSLTIKVVGKGAKHRLVPFSHELRKMMWRWTSTENAGRFLFNTRNGTKLSQRNLLRDFHALGEKVGSAVRVHPHMFRHSFAVNWIRRGGDLFLLSKVLGHSDIKTTARYLRGLGIEDMKAAHSGISLLSARR